MHRRQFLTTATAGATFLAFPAVLRAQSKDPLRISFRCRWRVPSPRSLPTCSGAPSSRWAQREGRRHGPQGRRDIPNDEESGRPWAQRTKADREPEGRLRHRRLAARADGHQRADQGRRQALSGQPSDEISAKPNTATHSEALNPTITSRAVATFGIKGSASGGSSALTTRSANRTPRCSPPSRQLGGTLLGSTRIRWAARVLDTCRDPGAAR